MKIAICDDNMEYIYTLEKYLDELSKTKPECDAYQNGEALISAYGKTDERYDVIFLDMEMGELNGIETANLIREIDEHVIIVFITSHTKYMQRSFECMPFRFLVKPVAFEDFNKVYHEICKKLKDKPETLIFQENRSRIRLFCEDILFFESLGHSILIHTQNGTIHKIRKTMTELLAGIDNGIFVRVHRAFVVNLNHIYKIGEADVTMHHCDKPIPIGRTYKKEFVDKFLNYKERKYLL